MGLGCPGGCALPSSLPEQRVEKKSPASYSRDWEDFAGIACFLLSGA